MMRGSAFAGLVTVASTLEPLVILATIIALAVAVWRERAAIVEALPPIDRGYWRALAAIAAAFFVASLFVSASPFRRDDVCELYSALRLGEDRSERSPAFPLLLRLLHPLVPVSFETAFAFNRTVAALTMVPVFVIALRWFGTGAAGVCAVALYALAPTTLKFAGSSEYHLIGDLVFWSATAAASLMAYRPDRRLLWPTALSIALIGEFRLELIPICFVLARFAYRPVPEIEPRQWLRAGLGAALGIVPRSLVALGSFSGLYPKPGRFGSISDVSREAAPGHAVFAMLRQIGVWASDQIPRVLWGTVTDLGFAPATTLLAPFGLALLVRSGARRNAVLAGSLFALFYLIYFGTHRSDLGHRQQVLLPAALFAILAGGALARLWSRAGRLAFLPALLLSVALAGLAVAGAVREAHQDEQNSVRRAYFADVLWMARRPPGRLLCVGMRGGASFVGREPRRCIVSVDDRGVNYTLDEGPRDALPPAGAFDILLDELDGEDLERNVERLRASLQAVGRPPVVHPDTEVLPPRYRSVRGQPAAYLLAVPAGAEQSATGAAGPPAGPSR